MWVFSAVSSVLPLYCMSNKQSCERLIENKSGTSCDVTSCDSRLHKPSAQIKTFPMISVFTNWCSGGCCPHYIIQPPKSHIAQPTLSSSSSPATASCISFSNCSFVRDGPLHVSLDLSCHFSSVFYVSNGLKWPRLIKHVHVSQV